MRSKIQAISAAVLGGIFVVSCGRASPAATPTIGPSPTITSTATAVKTAVPLFPVDTAAPSPTPVPRTLYVKADETIGTISPLIYGSNYGPWENVSSRVVPDLIDAGIRLLRYPGGAYVDENMFSESGFDEFMKLAKKLGAEPLVEVKLVNDTPKKAADVVKYVNITKQYGVLYWSIGNEPNLYAQKYNLYSYDAETFNQDWRAFALAMKAVDPNIQLVGPDTGQFMGETSVDPIDPHGKDWLKEFLWANGDLVDVVAVHRYPFGSNPLPTITDLRVNSAEWDSIIPNLRFVIHNELGRDLPIAFTEFNSNYTSEQAGDATPDSFYNAIWLADVLGRMGRDQVDIAAQFCLEGAGGLGLTHSTTIRPSLYIYKMYKLFGSKILFASSDAKYLNIYAAKTEDGRFTLMVINLDVKDISKTITIDGVGVNQQAETWRFDSEQNTVQIDPTVIDGETPVVFPAQSVTLFILQPLGA
jgi:hypothetical protein